MKLIELAGVTGVCGLISLFEKVLRILALFAGKEGATVAEMCLTFGLSCTPSKESGRFALCEFPCN